MESIFSVVITVAIVSVICFGPLAISSRSLTGMAICFVFSVSILALLTALGSGLVGPFDMRPMIALLPVTIATHVIWFLWKVRPASRHQ